MPRLVIPRNDFDTLLLALVAAGYTVVGPTVAQGAISYDRIDRVEDLPIGWTDEQAPGVYRLHPREDDALFGYAVGQKSWKSYLYPPRSTLFTVTRAGGSWQFAPGEVGEVRYAMLGVRACELAAIAVQDRVFLGPGHPDRVYQTFRRDLFTIGVNCGVAGGTCFCVSMETGPRCESGYDLVLTELLDGGRHEFVLEAGSVAGEAIVEQLSGRPATDQDLVRVDEVVERTSSSMGRSMNTDGIKQLLYDNPEHPRWDEVADRCLACTNCTLVCPTCFCSTVEDSVTLDGSEATRTRRWDSCFSLDFSALHGVPVRESRKARYRQWMTHKLATWYDQFGSSGCVGCGRCITWCPVGIDITEEVAAIRSTQEVMT
ncbi:MAG: 4Fe-4S dicluster domain-containing protein [Acidimicrobiia bacterium]